MKKYLSRIIAAFLALTLLTAPACALSVSEALELLEENYYFDIPEEVYSAETLDELFQILGDPYTGYMTEEQYAAWLSAVEDTVDQVGIGVEIYYTEDGFLVSQPLPGGSAQAAGILTGDLITAVDGVSCAPATEESRALMLGAEGTSVTITVLRDGETRDYTLIRKAIYIPNTEFAVLDGGIGYIDCNSFGLDTGELFADGLRKYDSQVSGWIVDLRDNAGGYVDAAADMLSALSGPGRYIYLEYKDGQVSYYGRNTRAVSDKPVLVLVNGYSASASEALASGVRDLERGIIIGSRTFGKGVAQIALDGESNPEYFDGDCLKVTTARFYSVGGTTTDKIGVIPTLLVEDGYVEAVVGALYGGSADTSTLCVMLEAELFYVDPETPDDVLCALLESVSPQSAVFYNGNGVFGQCTPAQAAADMGLSIESRWFTDVEDSYYDFAINTMGTYGLLNGTEPGVFSPKEQLTRAQLCVMLARALNVSSVGSSRFVDVPNGEWYADGVNAMAELGLVTGVGDGRFAPEDTLTQEEFLTIMGRMARYLNFALDSYGEMVENPQIELPMDMQLGLAPYSDWARASVAVLTWGLMDVFDNQGDMLYTSLERIDPSAAILREEAAAGMYRVLAGLEILP